MGTEQGLNDLLKDWDNQVEDVRAELLEHDEHVLLEALVQNTVIDPKTGMLTDYWLNLLKPELASYDFDMDHCCECGMDDRLAGHAVRHAEWVEQVTKE